MASTANQAGARYWLLVGGAPCGPFTVAQVHTKLAAGEITGQTQACPLGSSTWLPLVQTPGLGPGKPIEGETRQIARPAPAADEVLDVLPAAMPAGPATVLPAAVPASAHAPAAPRPESRPWNPMTIAWLGVLFTPVWAGVMAALNGRRLGTPGPRWLAPAIGFGALGLDAALGLYYDSYLLSLALYLGALALLWLAALRPQQQFFERWRGSATSAAGGWVWPSLAGVPLFLLAFYGFVVDPLRPLGPREVARRFTNAASAEEARRYSTLNLWPALPTIFGQPGSGNGEPPVDFELTDDGPAPADVGGHVVGFRVALAEAGQQHRAEGLFHLVQRDGRWKVEEMYVTERDRQPLEPWIVLSRDHAQFAGGAPAPAQGGAAAPRPAASTPALAQQKQWYENRGLQQAAARGAGHFLTSGGGKALGAILLAGLVAVVRFGREIVALLGSVFSGQQARG